jgi:7-cyano-7-deazaguanine synthase
MRSLVLLSGGQDSATCLAMAVHQAEKSFEVDSEVIGLSINYGQTHRKELECAKQLCRHFSVPRIEIELPKIFKNSPLVGRGEIPEDWSEEQGPAPTIVPGRNLVFLAIAASIAEQNTLTEVWTGVSAVDYSGYPDCRPEFIGHLNGVIRESSQGKVHLVTPLIQQTKAWMISTGTDLGVPWEHTWTCYRGQEKACGRCPSCNLRIQAFKANRMIDPIPYEVEVDWNA